jgi:hypothetical protein
MYGSEGFLLSFQRGSSSNNYFDVRRVFHSSRLTITLIDSVFFLFLLFFSSLKKNATSRTLFSLLFFYLSLIVLLFIEYFYIDLFVLNNITIFKLQTLLSVLFWLRLVSDDALLTKNDGRLRVYVYMCVSRKMLAHAPPINIGKLSRI